MTEKKIYIYFYVQNYNRADSKLYKDAAKLQRVMKSKLEELEDDVEVVPILEEVSSIVMD